MVGDGVNDAPVPEVGGAIDPDNEAHDLIMSVFGGMSTGERNRIRVRVRAAMAAEGNRTSQPGRRSQGRQDSSGRGR
jgi:site-specific DNA recombinase